MFEFRIQISGDGVRSSVNDVKCSNAIVSDFRNEVVFWGAYCQNNSKPETRNDVDIFGIPNLSSSFVAICCSMT